jgi:hypothetical protein
MTQLTDILDDLEYNGAYRIAGGMAPMPEVHWDALEEWLFDLSWWDGPVCPLVEQAEALGTDDLELLADIWGEAASIWAAMGRVFTLIPQGFDHAHLLTIE